MIKENIECVILFVRIIIKRYTRSFVYECKVDKIGNGKNKRQANFVYELFYVKCKIWGFKCVQIKSCFFQRSIHSCLFSKMKPFRIMFHDFLAENLKHQFNVQEEERVLPGSEVASG